MIFTCCQLNNLYQIHNEYKNQTEYETRGELKGINKLPIHINKKNNTNTLNYPRNKKPRYT